MRSPPPPPRSSRLLPEDWLGPLDLDGAWTQRGPRIVDLGCGKGRFLLAHALRNPEARLLGVERKLRRIRKIDHKAYKAGLENIRLLRMEAHYTMGYLIPASWIDQLFVYFPDPWPKDRHHKNRIFSPEFLDTVDRTLAADGIVHFATDHAPYAEQVREILGGDPRWTAAAVYEPLEEEISDFELMWRDQRPTERYSFRRAEHPGG